MFDHVIKDVMGFEDDDLLVKALDSAGIASIPDLLVLTDGQIDNLDYDDGTGSSIPSLADRNKLRILRAWNIHLQGIQSARRVDWLDPSTVNEDEWDEYRVATYVPPGVAPPVAPPPVPTAPPAAQGPRSTSTYNPASDFRRGIKRDKTHYTEIKDEKQWDEFKRKTIATAYAHGCENVINSSYVPISSDDVVLFEEQKKFMYDVWTTILKTPMGKHFVRQHEGTRDAQAVWRDYVNYMRSSTRADIEIEGLMTTLTSLRISPATKMTAQQFILEWLDKLRIYEDLTPMNAHFPDIMKKAMLQNALNGVKDFQDVKTAEQMEIAKGQGPMTYQAYIALVQQVAAAYDVKMGPQIRASIDSSRKINVAEMDDYDESGMFAYEYDQIDDTQEYFGSTSVFAAQTQQRGRGKRPSLPKAVWSAMSRSDQLAWDNISDQAKFKIMFAYKDHLVKPVNPPANRLNAQVHDSAPLDDHALNAGEFFQDASQEPPDEAETTLLVQAAAQKTPIAPSDLRRVISTKNAKKNNKPKSKQIDERI